MTPFVDPEPDQIMCPEVEIPVVVADPDPQIITAPEDPLHLDRAANQALIDQLIEDLYGIH